MPNKRKQTVPATARPTRAPIETRKGIQPVPRPDGITVIQGGKSAQFGKKK